MFTPSLITFPSAKITDPEVSFNQKYSSPPVYQPADPLNVEVPLNPRYASTPVYNQGIRTRYKSTPVYRPSEEKSRNPTGYKALDEAGVPDTYYGLLRSRNHYTYNSPDCVGNNYYNT